MEGAEQLVRSLEAHGVEHVFGVCGDTSVGLYRAFSELDHDINHVLARDERSASFMADAYARLGDKPGVCEGPSGGGATYLIPGLSEANDSAVPVVGLNTTIPVRYRGRGVLTELNQSQLFDAVTKWSGQVDHTDQLAWMVRQAFRQATTGRPGATHLSFPMDVLNGTSTSAIFADEHTTRYPAYRPVPDATALDEAAELIDDSQRPVMVVGGGVHSSRAWYEVRELAERTGSPVASSLTGAGCIGDSGYYVGVVGENGAREYANEIVRESDTLILLGTAVESVWTNKWTQPVDGEKTVIHADIDPTSIGKNYRTDASLEGDLRATLRSLLERVSDDEKWSAEELRVRHEAWVEPFEREFTSTEFPIRPERMVADAVEVLDEPVIVSDPGTSTPYFAALYEFSKPGRYWVTPRAHGALGYAIPGVVGAHFARPDDQIVGFTGDGSFGICAGELETISRLDLPVTIVVINNSAFSWIEAGQRNFADFSFGVEFQELDHARIAEEFGIAGFRVESAAEFEPTLREAVDLDGPAVIDLPTRPLPTIENAPVEWLRPGD